MRWSSGVAKMVEWCGVREAEMAKMVCYGYDLVRV